MHMTRKTWITATMLALSLGFAAQSAVAAPSMDKRAPHHNDRPDHPGMSAPATTPLTTNQWRLDRVEPGRNKASSIRLPRDSARLPQLRFVPEQSANQGRLVVTGLCNTLSGAYWVNGSQLRATNFISTMMACADRDRMKLEKGMASQLTQLTSYRVTQGRNAAELELQFTDGSRWQLSGKQTDEARYGQAERVFLEVAPNTVPCNHPLMRNAKCLKVRTLVYDEAGRKRVTSDWQVYSGQIEGYQHQAGMRNVLRLKRYHRNNPPADASSLVDVLDLVVESERVR